MSEPRLYWEDFEPGPRVRVGSKHVTKEEILAFAREYDPQPFHLDEAAARASLLGGLCASGWHTCAIAMRMMVDGYLWRTASMGAPGVEETRWRRPLFAGDTVTLYRRVLERRTSQSKPRMGLTRFAYELENERGETVMTMSAWGMLERRPG